MPDWGAAASRREDAASGGAPSPVVQAAERLVVRIEALVREVGSLRAENASLRKEVREAVALFDRAGSALTAEAPARRGRKRAAAAPQQRKRKRKPVKGRATPPSVTGEVVRAVLGKLGSATASEIPSCTK